MTLQQTWPGPLFWAVGDYPYPSVPQRTHPDLVSDPGYPSAAGYYVPKFNATNDAAFSHARTTEMEVLLAELDFIIQNPSLIPPLSFFDASSTVAQPQLVGDCGAPLAAYSVVSGVSPASTTPTSQDEWAGLSDFLRTPYTTPALSPEHGGEAGWPALEHGVNVFEATTSPAGRDVDEFSWSVPAGSGHVTSNATATYAPTTALGKRRREAGEPQGDGGLEVGRGAERLTTPNTHGIYHQSLPGPSFQQGWVVEPVDGNPTWGEGSVDEGAAHRIDNTVQQQQEEATELFKIPHIFKPRYRLLLQASEADFARGAVQTIKCRLCPDTKLKDFEEFKRHCKTTETHPLEIHFCDRCGDFFARCDSLKRHHNQPPAECRKVTLAEAVEKRRVTEQEHEDFLRQLDNGLMTGGRSFSQIIKEKYPKSSKKRTGGSK